MGSIRQVTMATQESIETLSHNQFPWEAESFTDSPHSFQDEGWMSTFEDIYALNAFPTPPPTSVQSRKTSAASHYQPSSGPEDDVQTATVNKERRRIQNKRAQQAFRKRKDTKLHELENQVSELKSDLRRVVRKYSELRSEHLRLQSGLTTLLNVNLGTPDDLAAMSTRLEKDLCV